MYIVRFIINRGRVTTKPISNELRTFLLSPDRKTKVIGPKDN